MKSSIQAMAKVYPNLSMKSSGQGTRLGLSLVYDIVTQGHGGISEMESAEGIGTVFISTLPLKTNGR